MGKYRIDPGLPLSEEVRRIGNGEIDSVIARLSGARGERHAAMHEARKHFKKLRGLLRLVQRCDAVACRVENARYRDVARTLAGAREATALIETVDRFLADFPEETAGGELAAIRTNLVERRDRVVHSQVGMEATLTSAIAACSEGKAAFAGLALPDDPDEARDLLASGAANTVRRARRALRHAAKRGAAEDFHELRKSVKTHWMHLLLLRDVWPKATKARCKQADALGERLGELNDIAVMRALLKSDDEKLGAPEEIAVFLALMKRKEKSLRRSCLGKARKLFSERPRKVRKRIRKAEPRGAAEADAAEATEDELPAAAE